MGWSANLQAQRLYKVVDASGKVTFSQHPPLNKPNAGGQAAKIESIFVDANASKSQVVTRGSRKYYGDISLPNVEATSSDGLIEIAEHRREWDASLRWQAKASDRKGENYDHRYSNKYRNLQTGNENSMRDLRCAIDWAEAYKGEIRDLSGLALENVSGLQKKIAGLNKAKRTNCGSEPYRSSKEHATWSLCGKRYDKKINKIKKMVYEENRKAAADR